METHREHEGSALVIAFAVSVLAVAMALLLLLLPAGIHVSGQAFGVVVVAAGIGAVFSLMAALRH
jgi:hypothetical protein